MSSHLSPHVVQTTHEVTNQSRQFENVNVFEKDVALKQAVAKAGASVHNDRLSALGARVTSPEVIEWGFQAHQNVPKLKSFDRYGHRLDEVEFHPAYHHLMDLGLSSGLASAPWTVDEAGHTLHAALQFLMCYADTGVTCPIDMTYAAVPSLRNQPEVAEQWVPGALSGNYDPRFIPADQKTGLTIGMAMTEKQGGSDIRANSTRAEAIGGIEYILTGHKWFCSAPMCDAFLTLAQTDAGVTCFLVPRWKPDNTRNNFHIMRLKDKIGDRSNASSEIEYHGAFAWRVGEEGRGVKTIIEMVQHTRLDCLVGSAAGMRQSLTQAMWHTSHRSAFQRRLIDQPAMRGVLADLALESEAATAAAFRVASSFDKTETDEHEAAFQRLATPIIKYLNCKRQPAFVTEALECHGGHGYIEEGVMARLFRTSPLNSIWEGSGNVIALDILRAISREPDSLQAVRDEIQSATGLNSNYDNHARELEEWMQPGALHEGTARRFAEDMGLALQAAALLKSAPDYVANGFCNTRFDKNARAYNYGAQMKDVDEAPIIDRAMVA